MSTKLVWVEYFMRGSIQPIPLYYKFGTDVKLKEALDTIHANVQWGHWAYEIDSIGSNHDLVFYFEDERDAMMVKLSLNA